jgi:hypothetical protein
MNLDQRAAFDSVSAMCKQWAAGEIGGGRSRFIQHESWAVEKQGTGRSSTKTVQDHIR